MVPKQNFSMFASLSLPTVGSDPTQPAETVEIAVATQNTLNRHSQLLIGDTPSTPIHTATPSSNRPSVKKVGSGVSRGSRRKSRRSAKSLATSPALRFITRKDLYSFLSSAGVSGCGFSVGGCGFWVLQCGKVWQGVASGWGGCGF